jgi:hypothetical protein
LDDIFPLTVDWYKNILRVNANTFSNPSSKQYALIDIDNETLSLYGYGDKRVTSLKGINGELQKHFATNNNNNLSPSDLTFTLTSGKIEVKLIMQSYSIKNPKYSGGDNLGVYVNISGYALVRGE